VTGVREYFMASSTILCQLPGILLTDNRIIGSGNYQFKKTTSGLDGSKLWTV
jgi:hypothetical protein